MEWNGADLNWGKMPTKTFNETGGENKFKLTYNSMYKNICNNQKELSVSISQQTNHSSS